MNRNLLFATALAFSASVANAIVSVNIKSVGWGDDTAAANDMTWGLIVAASGGDFSGSFTADLASNIVGFDPAPIANPANGTQIFNEYYFVRSLADSSSSGPPNNAAGYFNDVRFNLDTNVSSGDKYGLLWLPSGDGEVAPGNAFGFQDLGQTIPTDGTTTANIPGNPGLATFTAVPEPSAFALFSGLMGLAFGATRRRC